jgi:hypothetical protein
MNPEMTESLHHKEGGVGLLVCGIDNAAGVCVLCVIESRIMFQKIMLMRNSR